MRRSLVSQDLLRLMLGAYKSLEIDLGGHVFANDSVIHPPAMNSSVAELLTYGCLALGEVTEDVFRAALEGRECFPGGRTVLLETYGVINNCAFCGQHPVFVFDGRALRPEYVCSVSRGPFEAEFHLPSGRLVLGLDSHPLVPIHDDGLGGGEAFAEGRLLEAQIRLENHVGVNVGTNHNIAACIVPGSFRKLQFRNDASDSGRDPSGFVAWIPERYLSMMDERALMHRGGPKGKHVVIALDPGVYRVRLFYDYDREWIKRGENRKNPSRPYLTLEWIRPEAQELDDSAFRAMELTLGQVLWCMRQRMPMSFDSPVAAADWLFGSSASEWHPNGFPLILDGARETPEVSLPEYGQTTYQDWERCLHSSGALERAAQGTLVLAPTFLRAARSLLQVIHDPENPDRAQRERARQLLHELNARYPS